MIGAKIERKSIFDDEIISRFKELRLPTVFVKPLRRHLVQVLLPEIRAGKIKCENEDDEIKLYDLIPNISLRLREILKNEYRISTSAVSKVVESDDHSTVKLLIELKDGNKIESVIMKYGSVEFDKYIKDLEIYGGSAAGEKQFKSRSRATLCLSSEVGCGMGCTFCATGTMGLIRSLTCSEIVEQLWHASKIVHIRNIVFMGMGEPLNNYDNVVSATNVLVDQNLFSIAGNRITISTVGVVHRLRQMTSDIPFVSLAFSLHAPTDEMRCKIVPLSKNYKIRDILDACDEFASVTGRSYMIEYVLISGVNDQIDTAHKLGKLLKWRNVFFNLIPYNPTPVPHNYEAPPLEHSRKFIEVLKSHGVRTFFRQTLGSEVNSACGQLHVEHLCPKKPKSVELEDLFLPPKKEEAGSAATSIITRSPKVSSKTITSRPKRTAPLPSPPKRAQKIVFEGPFAVAAVVASCVLSILAIRMLSVYRPFLSKSLYRCKRLFTERVNSPSLLHGQMRQINAIVS